MTVAMLATVVPLASLGAPFLRSAVEQGHAFGPVGGQVVHRGCSCFVVEQLDF